LFLAYILGGDQVTEGPEALSPQELESLNSTGQYSPRMISRAPRYKNVVHLWEFLLELLASDNCRSIITWTNKDRLEFKFLKPEEVAKRWGAFKNVKMSMNYEKLSRALRAYYRNGIVKKVDTVVKIIYH